MSFFSASSAFSSFFSFVSSFFSSGATVSFVALVALVPFVAFFLASFFFFDFGFGLYLRYDTSLVSGLIYCSTSVAENGGFTSRPLFSNSSCFSFSHASASSHILITLSVEFLWIQVD